MKRVMIDIETLGTRPDAIIAEVGIVVGEEGKIDFSLQMTLNWAEQEGLGRKIDVATLLWWTKAGRMATFKQLAERQTCVGALKKRLESIEFYLRGADEVWANSPSFDLAVINNLFEQVGLLRVNYKREMDFRTVRKLHPGVAYDYPEDAHNALADAQAQVAHLRKLGIWPEVFKPLDLQRGTTDFVLNTSTPEVTHA